MTHLYYLAVGLFTATGLLALGKVAWWLVAMKEAVFDGVAELWENFGLWCRLATSARWCMMQGLSSTQHLVARS